MTNRNGGQTMIEVLVGLTIITLILSGVMIVQLTAIKNAQEARNRSLASKYATEQLERARAVRDIEGIHPLFADCQAGCYISESLESMVPVPAQEPVTRFIRVSSGLNDCPLPQVTIYPRPEVIKVISVSQWGPTQAVKEVSFSTCLTN